MSTDNKNIWTGNEEKAVGGRLENWETMHNGSVVGIVYDDPRGDRGEGHDFSDGNLVITSKIVSLNEQEGRLETMNTVYKLGKRLQVK